MALNGAVFISDKREVSSSTLPRPMTQTCCPAYGYDCRRGFLIRGFPDRAYRTHLLGNSPPIGHSNVRHDTLERSLDIGSPASAHCGPRPNERLIFRLPHVEKILEVGDDRQRPE